MAMSSLCLSPSVGCHLASNFSNLSKVSPSFNGISSVHSYRSTLQVERSASLSFFSKKRSHVSQCAYSDDSVASTVTIDVEAYVQNEKILVLGGNGFVGSAVCKSAVDQGIDVISLNRSGRPPYSDTWINDVTWLEGDVFSIDWDNILNGVSTVVSCIGGFGSNDAMERINGDATIAAVTGVLDSNVERFIFVSVHDYNLPSFALDNGYFNGKRRAEAQIIAKFPVAGVILRPGFIYGTRRVNSMEIPLDLVGRPLESVLKATERFTKPLTNLPFSDLLFAPPVSVEDVASAVVAAVTDKSVYGIIPIEKIKEMAKTVKV